MAGSCMWCTVHAVHSALVQRTATAAQETPLGRLHPQAHAPGAGLPLAACALPAARLPAEWQRRRPDLCVGHPGDAKGPQVRQTLDPEYQGPQVPRRRRAG
jgi:hypothetical protein